MHFRDHLEAKGEECEKIEAQVQERRTATVSGWETQMLAKRKGMVVATAVAVEKKPVMVTTAGKEDGGEEGDRQGKRKRRGEGEGQTKTRRR